MLKDITLLFTPELLKTMYHNEPGDNILPPYAFDPYFEDVPVRIQ
jgi:hypothetical protein